MSGLGSWHASCRGVEKVMVAAAASTVPLLSRHSTTATSLDRAHTTAGQHAHTTIMGAFCSGQQDAPAAHGDVDGADAKGIGGVGIDAGDGQQCRYHLHQTAPATPDGAVCAVSDRLTWGASAGAGRRTGRPCASG
jgi:hypothetical protein